MSRRDFPYKRHPDFTYSVVEARSTECPRNDTASVSALDDATWMVVWHKYRTEALHSTHHGSSDFARCDIAAKISRDEGLTWGEERILIEADPEDNNDVTPHTAGSRISFAIIGSGRIVVAPPDSRIEGARVLHLSANRPRNGWAAPALE